MGGGGRGGPLSLQGMECLWEEGEGSLVSARCGVPMGGGGEASARWRGEGPSVVSGSQLQEERTGKEGLCK